MKKKTLKATVPVTPTRRPGVNLDPAVAPNRAQRRAEKHLKPKDNKK